MEPLSKDEKKADDTPSKSVKYSKKILDFGEACLYLGISKQKLADLTYEGHIRAFRLVEDDLHYKKKHLNKWLLKRVYKVYEEINLRKHGIRHKASKAA